MPATSPSPSTPPVTAPSAPPPTPPVEAAPVKMVLMKLDRHYRPAGTHEVVGHHIPRIERKDPMTNQMKVVQEAAFMAGEPMPPPQAGVGSQASGKLWAGTVARFTAAEAKHIRANGIGTVEVDDAA